MATPLYSVGYDHLVVLDSQVVLEGKPLEQMPWSSLFAGSILLLVTRQVQTEIDRRKSDGRLGKRARAFNKLLDYFIEQRIPSLILTSPKVDVATVANRPIDWSGLDDLDREDGDDRIVAQALNALVDDPAKLVLLSHDMRPRDAAATHGLRAVKLPETWLRDPEPSPDQRRINELEARNRLLSADQPQVDVALKVVTPEPWRYLTVGPASQAQVEAIMIKKLARAPQQGSRRGNYGLGFTDYDSSHDGRLEDWRTMLREDLPLMHEGLARMHAQHRIRVTIPMSDQSRLKTFRWRSGQGTLSFTPSRMRFSLRGQPRLTRVR